MSYLLLVVIPIGESSLLVIAHRGALHEALENSMSAFARAIDAGAERIELDVQLGRDGDVVIMHDGDLSRSCGISKHIGALSHTELKQVKLKNGESLPFLDDVLEEFLDKIEFNVEIKGRSKELAEATATTLRKFNRNDRFIVSCFNQEPLLYFLEYFPQIRRACLIGDTPQWPNISERSPLIFMQKIQTNIIHPWAPWVNENFMDQAKARRWLVYPYCSAKGEEDEDKFGLWTTLQTLGIDGLCTNYPREMKAWLHEHKRRYEAPI